MTDAQIEAALNAPVTPHRQKLIDETVAEIEKRVKEAKRKRA